MEQEFHKKELCECFQNAREMDVTENLQKLELQLEPVCVCLDTAMSAQTANGATTGDSNRHLLDYI